MKKNKTSSVYEKIKSKKGQIAILIDPEKSQNKEELLHLIKLINLANVNYIFIGGSTVSKTEFDFVVNTIKSKTPIPIVIFPGGSNQITEEADAILYLSLLSGRNPDFLIGHHVQSANELLQMDLEVIPTGYILIDGGVSSSVAYVSQTSPIPRDQPSIALNTAKAGKLLGKQIIFFDAGSGATYPVPPTLIQHTDKIDVPVIVGGGIRTIEALKHYKDAGANVIVIGNHIEENIDFLLDLKNYVSINN